MRAKTASLVIASAVALAACDRGATDSTPGGAPAAALAQSTDEQTFVVPLHETTYYYTHPAELKANNALCAKVPGDRVGTDRDKANRFACEKVQGAYMGWGRPETIQTTKVVVTDPVKDFGKGLPGAH